MISFNHRHLRSHSLAVLLAVALASLAVLSRSEEEESELDRLREWYRKDVEFATRPIRDRYLSRLDVLKRSLGSRGNARGALAVQEEIDRIKDMAGGVEKFAGVWSIRYTNGTVRTYSITSGGMLTTYVDERPAKAAKISKIGADFIVDSVEGAVERLSVAGDTLTIEHFNPRTSYPAEAPAVRATGKRVGSTKP